MRPILLALVLLVAASEMASAFTLTVTVVNHRPTALVVLRPNGFPCSTDGGYHSDHVQDRATFTCDSAGRALDQGNFLDLGLNVVSSQGGLVCSLDWTDHPYKTRPWWPDEPAGLRATQLTNSGAQGDKTAAGCTVSRTGPSDYQLDVGMARNWFGDEY